MRCRRRGLSMIEVVTVMALVALLAAILLPAIQAARESGRRINCAANLAEIGKALSAHEANQRAFPSAVRATHRNPLESDQSLSPFVYLLPHLGRADLFQTINLQQNHLYQYIRADWGEASNITVALFLCPSDPVPDDGTAGNNYRACMGPGRSEFPSYPSSGPFSALESHPAGAFRDGLSNTIAMSEKLRGGGNPDRYSSTDFWFSGIYDLLGRHPDLDQLIDVCGSLQGQPADFYAHAGGTWFYAGYDHTWYNHAVTPNAKTADCSDLTDSPWGHISTGGVFKASSYHPGGVNCLLMDGVVRFVSDGVALDVWRAYSTRAGAEALGDEVAF